MSVGIDKLASELQKVIEEKDKNKKTPYDTEAEVVRVDTEVVWVKIPGGVDETPAQKTINAKVGDLVRVRVSGGRAFLVGNGTNPPTDDTKANEASYQAQNAEVHAFTAEQNAIDAHKSAESARVDAAVAHDMADKATQEAMTAQNEAETAKSEAVKAYNAANDSLIQLGIVEDVVGALNWIASHGIYIKSTDTEAVNGKFYFELSGRILQTPTGNPMENGYYEKDNSGVFVLSTDETIDEEKTYYLVTATAVNPTESPAINYYELKDVDQAVSQYISTHLALDDGGLHVVNDQSRIDLTDDGIDIWKEGTRLAHYGNDACIGDASGYHIEITAGDDPKLSFKNSAIEIAYLSKDQLYIPRAVVVDAMQIGDESAGGAWKWVIDSTSRDLTLLWIGGTTDV